MLKGVALRCWRKRSGSAPASRNEHSAFERAVSAAVEPLERRVFLSTTPAWLAAGSAATWDPASHDLSVTGPTTIVADPGADEPLVTVGGTGATLTIQPASDAVVHLGGLTLADGGCAEVTRANAASFNEAASLVLLLGLPGAGGASALSIDSFSGSTLGLEDNDLIVRQGAAGQSAYLGRRRGPSIRHSRHRRHAQPTKSKGTGDQIKGDGSL